jgi:hypothetical protein
MLSTQHNIRSNDNVNNGNQYNDTQHNESQHYSKNVLLMVEIKLVGVAMLSVVRASVAAPLQDKCNYKCGHFSKKKKFKNKNTVFYYNYFVVHIYNEESSCGRHDTQHNDIQHKGLISGTQHSDIQHNDTLTLC